MKGKKREKGWLVGGVVFFARARIDRDASGRYTGKKEERKLMILPRLPSCYFACAAVGAINYYPASPPPPPPPPPSLCEHTPFTFPSFFLFFDFFPPKENMSRRRSRPKGKLILFPELGEKRGKSGGKFGK